MKTFKLTKEAFIEYTTEHDDLSYVLVEDLDTLEKNINSMKTLIDYFNTEYKWDGMFNIDEVKNRIISGLTLFMLYYDKQPIGYIWFKEIDKNTSYLYNLYVTNTIKRPNYSPLWFVNKTVFYILQYYKTITIETHEWNVAAIKIFYKSGAKSLTIL